MIQKCFWASRLVFTCFVLLFCISCSVNPVTKQSEFVLMGEAQEVRLGEELYAEYTQLSYGLFQDPTLQEYVQQVGSGLARVSDRPHLRYEFNVVNDSRVNAYALPGGKISITRGMLAKMENEAQLAAVLGHEIGHVAARHSAKGYTRNVLAGILSNIAAVALESSSVTGSDLILQSGQVLSNMVLMKYSRNQERQADQLGMEYMVRAGYNPQGMIGVTEILQSLSERRPSLVEVMFSSHPPSQERYQAALQQAQTYPDSSIGSDTLYIQPFQRATTSIRRTQPAYAKMDEALKIAKSDGDYEKARDIIVGASAEAPNQALIWMMRAEFERKTKQRQQAYRSAKHSVRLYPGLFYGQYLAGITAFEVREYRQSLDHLERADSIFSGVSEIVYYKGRNYEVLGFRDRAAQAYYQFLQKVRKGEMAQYCYKRLRQWGYL